MTKNLYEMRIVRDSSLDLFKKISHAFASNDRIKILGYLYENPDVKYVEIAKIIQGNRKTGYFSYHMKWLKKSELVKHDERRELYCLSNLGLDCIDFIKRIEQRQIGAKALNDEGIFKDIDNPKKYIAFLKNTIRFYEANFQEEK